jgi:septation ring formation regulator EzrA
MELLTLLSNITGSQGLATALVLAAVIFWYFKLYPDRLKREAQQLKEMQHMRQLTLDELRELRKETNEGKRRMYDAFVAHTKATVDLECTLETLNTQITELTTEVSTMKTDIKNVYTLLGK